MSIRLLRLACAALFWGACLATSPASAEYRTIDGTGNNLSNPTWGSAGINLLRISDSAYDDGISAPRQAGLPNPRAVSNSIVKQVTMMPNQGDMTSWVFQWGQFIDHDIDLTKAAEPTQSLDIAIPSGDEIFDPAGTGAMTMRFSRSHYDHNTGTSTTNPREQVNEITAYLDGSNVYGSDATRALALRTLSGGRMKTSAGNLLPLNTFGLENDTGGPADPTQFYVAGDIRANEQVGLTAVHTLFVREHNRLADELAAANPTWTDEQIYQRARKFVGAEIQSITYQEFLPALLGAEAPSILGSYDNTLDASIANEFSTALFRVGHTMLPPELMRIQNDGTEAPGGSMSLRKSFFLPENMATANELDYLLKGLASNLQQNVDMHMVDDVRNFLFGNPVPGGFDLASLNIQRGRDHGLPDYNTVRVAYGLAPATSFADITSDTEIQAGLEAMYGSIDDIDAWVGALSEDHAPGCNVGELVAAGLLDQFTRLRDGDRFWFTEDDDFSADEIQWLSDLQLADLIRWNTDITNIQDQVFFMAIPEPAALSLAFLGLISLIGGRQSARQFGS